MASTGSSAKAWVVGLSRYGKSLNQGHGGSSEGSLALREKMEGESKSYLKSNKY